MQYSRTNQSCYLIFLHAYSLTFLLRRTCSQHHLEVIFISNIQYPYYFAVRHSLIRIKSHIHIGFLLGTPLQECGQFFQVYRHFILIAESSIEVQVLVNDYPRKRLCRSLLPALRKQYLDGIGRHHAYQAGRRGSGKLCGCRLSRMRNVWQRRRSAQPMRF